MSILSSRYGFARPRAVSAMLQSLQVALPCVPVIEAAPTPIPAPLPAAPTVFALQAERAGLRADLPFMRHYAANFDDGPIFAEIEAMESRLADLDDYLIFEPDFAAAPLLLAAWLANASEPLFSRGSEAVSTLRA